MTGLEAEVHDALAARLKDLTKTLPTGFLIPLAALKALNVTSAPAAGFTVGTDLAAIEPALRSKSVVVAMGATVFENLRGDPESRPNPQAQQPNGLQNWKSFRLRIRLTAKPF